jgi:mannose-6-phosphate isomerase-like protein (cupin superfamily)
MLRPILTATAAVLIFAAGFGAAHLGQPAQAAAMPLTPQLIDLSAIASADLPPASAAAPNLRQKLLAAQDGMTLSVQIGTIFKHVHNDANELQVVLEGTGTEWLGDKQVDLKPGDLVIVPKGTPHGGYVEKTGHLKIVAIKTPPQDPTDTHPVQ